MSGYRLYVNFDRTRLLRMWESGLVEVAERDSPDHTWGPPVTLEEERIEQAASKQDGEDQPSTIGKVP